MNARQVCKVCFTGLLPTQSTYCSPRCLDHGKSLRGMGQRKKKRNPEAKAQKRELAEIRNLRFRNADLLREIDRLRGELAELRGQAKPKVLGFYDSREWHVLRYKVIKAHGRVCMACGSNEGAMHVDHIKPRSRFPELALEFSNLQVLCKACNLGKSSWDETDFRA